MASIGRDPNGRRRILIVAADGSRKTLRLGKCSERAAEQVCGHVEELVATTINGQTVRRETAVWLSGIGEKLHSRLARAGLVFSQKVKECAMLGPSLSALLDSRVDLKPATKVVRRLVMGDLKEFFGETSDIRSVTPGGADDFKQWLIGRKLASTTIHKRLQVARSFFHALHRRKLVEENPFDGVRFAAVGIKDRQRFITRQEVNRVLDACPDHHWRAIVALSRYGGLRCPSEVLSVRWQDVNWETGRVTVPSPKTEHHGVAKASRVIPLFPELRSTLMEAFEAAPEGTEYVIDDRFRRAAMGPGGWQNANLRTTFGKIVRRAGLTPWPRLFHNLRASRETELVESYPVQVVTGWLGNSPTIAMRHYLMTTDAHFEAAIRGDSADEKAAQIPAQQLHAPSRNASHENNAKMKKPEFFGALQEFAAPCNTTETREIEGTTRFSNSFLARDRDFFDVSFP